MHIKKHWKRQMNWAEHFEEQLNTLKAQQAHRSLKESPEGFIDFSSNDYLGLAKKSVLVEASMDGGTGSRLLTGQREKMSVIEDEIASFHNAEKGLVFSSGYMANYALMSTLFNKEQTVLVDEMIHASLWEGLIRSKTNIITFKHNSFNDAASKCQQHKPAAIILESLYSMDGDICPLYKFGKLSEFFNVPLVVDEAHANGIYGSEGKGLVYNAQIEKQCLASVHTFGKGVGFHGAIICGSSKLIDYLINFCRPFIFTTAPPLTYFEHLKQKYKQVKDASEDRRALHRLIEYYRKRVAKSGLMFLSRNQSPIQFALIPGNEKVLSLAKEFEKHKMDLRPIRHPSVAKGAERIRICLHSYNTWQQVDEMISIFEQFNRSN